MALKEQAERTKKQYTHRTSEILPRKQRSEKGERVLQACRSYLTHRKAIVVIFLLFTVACVMCIPQVKVNYSMTDYLPKSSESVIALDDMEDAFGSGVTNARLYAEGIDLSTADELSTSLGNIEGISEVMWLGTAVDTSQPVEIQNQETVNTWKTDSGYLYEMTIDGATAVEAIEQARSTAEATGASHVSMAGNAVDTADVQSSASTEIVNIMIAAVIIILIILLITSHSWFEPIVFFIPIGIAIMMNMGTNIFIGEISYVSRLCGAILQLAVSMDYAIVLLHQFRRCQREYDDPIEAMAHAMKRGFSVVLSSAAVTFFAFLSLSVMEFGIGINMGLVLAKGIVFSFLSIMFFMPCFTLMCNKPLEALEHRYLIPSFDKLARGCQKAMLPMALVVILIAIPCYLGQSQTNFYYGTSDSAASDSIVQQDKDHINEAFGKSETWVVMVPEGEWAKEQELVDTLNNVSYVTGATSYVTVAGRAMPTEIVPEHTKEQVIANGWSRIVLTLDIAGENDKSFGAVEEIRSICHDIYGDEYRLAGNIVSIYDLREVVHSDSSRVELFSMLAIGIVLAVMFRSLSIPFIILIAIKIAIWINLAFPYFTGETISYIGYLVIDAIQLGAAVDYAIIYAREYFDRRQLYNASEAARSAIKHGGISIITSASVLFFAGTAIALVSSMSLVAELGALVARGALVSMLLMFIFLPWLFKILDKVISKTTIGINFTGTLEQDQAHVQQN